MWKIALGIAIAVPFLAALRALLQSPTYAWHKNSKGKNGQHFVLLPLVKNYRRKNGQSFVLGTCGATLASHSTVPSPSGIHTLQRFILPLPLPRALRAAGYGAQDASLAPPLRSVSRRVWGPQEVDEI